MQPKRGLVMTRLVHLDLRISVTCCDQFQTIEALL